MKWAPSPLCLACYHLTQSNSEQEEQVNQSYSVDPLGHWIIVGFQSKGEGLLKTSKEGLPWWFNG